MTERENQKSAGHCLCGAVNFTVDEMSHHVGACHCGMCRRWAGGPLMAIDCGPGVTWDGGGAISTYPSSQWAERGFCGRCGSHLFYRLKQDGRHFIPPGLFDDGTSLVFDHQVFIDRKPDYYAFAGETRDLTEAEIFAMYGASAPPIDTTQ